LCIREMHFSVYSAYSAVQIFVLFEFFRGHFRSWLRPSGTAWDGCWDGSTLSKPLSLLAWDDGTAVLPYASPPPPNRNLNRNAPLRSRSLNHQLSTLNSIRGTNRHLSGATGSYREPPGVIGSYRELSGAIGTKTNFKKSDHPIRLPPIACQFPFPCFHPSRLVKRRQA
jgi:hypothetical protein